MGEKTGLRGRFGEAQERISGEAGPEPCEVGVKQTHVGSWSSLARRDAHEGAGQRAVLLERRDDGQTAASVLQETAIFAQLSPCWALQPCCVLRLGTSQLSAPGPRAWES